MITIDGTLPSTASIRYTALAAVKTKTYLDAQHHEGADREEVIRGVTQQWDLNGDNISLC
jgi:hypothetical protein